ncbi:MAG: 4Fe-4S binding protein [Bacteroidales bacterium]|nr:4Fe-4S binding protein [Bacteroidales bacterium]MBN2819000.1 4Fe-4S binding protein [Bacteroidales bacterium]
MTEKVFHHALKILEDVCYGCTHCIRVCPTDALRVRYGKAYLLPERCIDCGKCMKACPVNAIIIDQDDFNDIFKYKIRIALVSSILIGQFPRHYSSRKIYSGILEQGFTHVYEAEHGAGILAEEINQFIENNKSVRPVISSFCPAIVRLIQVRFPSLVENIMLLKAPLDLAALSFKNELLERGYSEDEIGIFYVTPCAAKIAAIKSPVGEENSPINGVINMDLIYNKVYRDLKKETRSTCIVPEKEQLKAEEMGWSLTGGEARNINGRCLSIDGINNAIDFLEGIENGTITNFDFIEVRACDQSCAGGILTSSNRFLTTERLEERIIKYENDKIEGKIFNNKTIDNHIDFVKGKISIDKIEPRSILKLDDDMESAMKKMGRIQRILSFLPGIDCGACGTPSCKTLAEDIVQGRAKTSDCIFIQTSLNVAADKEIRAEKIWGKDRFRKLT